MTTEQTAKQLRLAASILETGHPWETSHNKERWWLATSADDPGVHVVNNQHIRLALATPPDGRAVHNPDNLTAEQVGAGYRLLLPEELDGRHQNNCEVWNGKGAWSDEKPVYARYKTFSYRLPLSLPWPEVEKPDPYAELKAAHAAGKVVQVIDCGRWLDLPTPNWCEPVGRYRIKPTESAPADEPKTKTVPLGPEDVPPGSVFRGAGEAKDPDDKGWCLITSCSRTGFRYWRQSDSDPEPICWLTLKAKGAQINRSLPLTGKWNPDAWEPCSKTIPADDNLAEPKSR